MSTHTPTLLLLGPVMLESAGVSTRLTADRRSQLLVRLALQPREWVERDRLAALMWPEHELAEARRNLRKVIFKARELAGEAVLEAHEAAVRLHVQTDLETLQQALEQSRTGEAVALLRGPPLAGLDDTAHAAWTDWLRDERARILARWQHAAHVHLEQLDDALSRELLARRLLEVDALDETAVRALIGLLGAADRVAEAQRSYRDYAMRLAQDLGVDPSHALADLMARIAGTSAAPRPAAVAQAAASAADDAASGFVGRRFELKSLQRLQSDGARLVTLLGPGGIGKSRLAREWLAIEATRLPGDAHWIELDALNDDAALLGRLAQRLGVTFESAYDAEAVARLATAMSGTPTLVALDNAEHLGGLPALVQALLAGAPSLQVLVTSRQRLGLAMEEVLVLEGLAVPDEDSRDAEAAFTFDAVRLFALRAGAAQRDFDAAAHRDAIVAIVEALGGMPLAIELAASWVRLLPPETIASDLRESIGWLERDPVSRAPAARPAHASLQGVLDQSWRLLAPVEREALATLAVFEGGFTRASAQAVARVSLPLLASLADKSLVAVGEEGRFSLHPVVAAYAAERLDESPEQRARMQSKHAEHYAARLGALSTQARADSRALLDGAGAELANARAAWRWALRHRRGDLVGQLVPTVRSFFEISGRYVEGVEWLREALALAATGATAASGAAGGQVFVRVRQALSTLLYRSGDVADAVALAEQGLLEAERTGDRYGIKGLLVCIGLCRWYEARAAQALAAFERVLALGEEDGDRYAVSIALSNMLHAEKALGHYERAFELGQRALALGRELGDVQGTVMRLVNLGDLQRVRRLWPQARALLDEALAQARGAHIHNAAQFAELNLALIDVDTGQHEAARPRLLALAEAARRRRATTVELPAELGLALAGVHAGAWDDVPARLQRVVDVSNQRALRSYALRALVVYGEWLAARGRMDSARRVLSLASLHVDLQQSERDDAAWRLARIAPESKPDAGGLTEADALADLARVAGGSTPA